MNRYRREQPNHFGLILGALLCGALVAFVAVPIYDRVRDATDGDRLGELQARHSGIVARAAALQPGPQRDRLEDSAREVAAEHDTILSRHPTWNVKPLTRRAELR